MAQATTSHGKTLFHLVPVPGNRPAEVALTHPDNAKFVSPSADGPVGLEIGFHVPRFSHGSVITRLGRNTDLILPESSSGVHVAFEFSPVTLVVMLSLRCKHLSSLTTAIIREGEVPEPLVGDCAVFYGERCRVNIAAYEFNLVWRALGGANGVQPLRDLAVKGYQDAMGRLKHVPSRDQSVAVVSDIASWHRTCIESAKTTRVIEIPSSRVKLGSGAFGDVFGSVDRATNNPLAVKVVSFVRVPPGRDRDRARVVLQREVSTLERLSHVSHFPDYLLITHWLQPLPLRDGMILTWRGGGRGRVA